MSPAPSRRELVVWVATGAVLAVLDLVLLGRLAAGLLRGTLGPWQPAVGHLLGVTLLVACCCCGVAVNRPGARTRETRPRPAPPGSAPPGRGRA